MAIKDIITGIQCEMHHAHLDKTETFWVSLDPDHPALKGLKQKRAELWSLSGWLSPRFDHIELNLGVHYKLHSGGMGQKKIWSLWVRIPEKIRYWRISEIHPINLRDLQGLKFDVTHRYDPRKEKLLKVIPQPTHKWSGEEESVFIP